MKQWILIVLFTVLLINAQEANAGKKKEKMVQIQTEYGTIEIKLYNETPLHRDNFLKLVQEGFYTDLLFHRVIQSFMIQGGDPESRNATPGQMLGNGDLGYSIPAEILPQFYHHRGVLAAAREGDQVNPQKRSSASQFYILQGKVFRPSELDSLLIKLEEHRKAALMQARIKAIGPEIDKLNKEGRQGEIIARINAIHDSVTTEAARLAPLTFSEQQRKAYTTIGGYPSLDNNYTIFGEVTRGMEVVDAIAKQQVDANNRPLKDIRFTIKRVK